VNAVESAGHSDKFFVGGGEKVEQALAARRGVREGTELVGGGGGFTGRCYE
jgi:hypothetical protein